MRSAIEMDKYKTTLLPYISSMVYSLRPTFSISVFLTDFYQLRDCTIFLTTLGNH